MGVQILGVSFDTPEENRSFAQKHGFPFPLLSDQDRLVGELYETRRGKGERGSDLPRRLTYLIDPQGTIAKVYRVEDIDRHPEEVLTDLKMLASGT